MRQMPVKSVSFEALSVPQVGWLPDFNHANELYPIDCHAGSCDAVWKLGAEFKNLSDSTESSYELSFWKKTAYGIGGIPMQMAASAFAFFSSIFLLETAHVDPYYMSFIQFGARAWDAITDPLVGYLVIKTKTRWGKMRPWFELFNLLSKVISFKSCLRAIIFIFVSHNPRRKWADPIYILLEYGTFATYWNYGMGFEVFAVLLGSTMFGAITTPYRRATSCQSASFVSNLTTGSYLLSTDFRPSEMVEPNIDALNEEWSYNVASGVLVTVFQICALICFFGTSERGSSATSPSSCKHDSLAGERSPNIIASADSGIGVLAINENEIEILPSMLSKDPGSPTVNSWASWPVQTNKNSIGNELNSVFSKATRATNFRPASIFPKANKRPLYRLHSVNASRTASLCLAYRSESVPESLSELEVTSGLSSGPISDQESRASFWCVDADNDSSGSALISYFTALRMILTFRPYLLLMGTFMFLSLGLQFLQGNLTLFITHSLKLGEVTTWGIMSLLSVAIISLPGAHLSVKRIGKKSTYFIGILLIIPVLIYSLFIPERVSLFIFYPLLSWTGLTVAVAYLLPWSMLPDVIDAFFLERGFRQEGIFYSLYVFFNKFAVGISLGLSGVVLGIYGYKADSCVQPESVGHVLRYLFGLVSLICLLISAVFLYYYPITDSQLKENRKRLLQVTCESEKLCKGFKKFSNDNKIIPVFSDNELHIAT